MLDEALDMQKNVLTWERPPFKVSRSAGDFLLGKTKMEPLLLTSYSVPNLFRKDPTIKDFDRSDFIDLCPQNSTPINHFLRKVLPQYIVPSLPSRNEGSSLNISPCLILGNPVWRGSSASISSISRVLISLLSVSFLIVAMFAMTLF